MVAHHRSSSLTDGLTDVGERGMCGILGLPAADEKINHVIPMELFTSPAGSDSFPPLATDNEYRTRSGYTLTGDVTEMKHIWVDAIVECGGKIT